MTTRKMSAEKIGTNLFVHITMMLVAVVTLLPMVLTIMISITENESILQYGYQIWPSEFSLDAYKYLFRVPAQLLKGYGVSIIVTGAGTVVNLLITAYIAYPLSRRDFAYRKAISTFLFIPMMFSGGTVASYILIVRYLGWKNDLLSLIIPGMAAPFTIFMLRVLFQDIPPSLMESAKIDGASEQKIFWRIVMPLSKPAIATIALSYILTYWNDVNSPILYITDRDMYPVTMVLNNIVSAIHYMKQLLADPSRNPMGTVIDPNSISSDAIMFAMMVVATVPLVIVFTGLQKYFVKGMITGAVKG